MRTVDVTRSMPVPADTVFDLLADHANYDRFRGIRRSELLSEGDPAPNGVGAMRLVVSGPIRFEEVITAYERPSKLDHLIVGINAPFEHEGGSIRFAERGGWTKVDWSTSFRVPGPLAGIQERVWA
jgi:polyketide cyclase/dehydrase/lipid transport protein